MLLLNEKPTKQFKTLLQLERDYSHYGHLFFYSNPNTFGNCFSLFFSQKLSFNYTFFHFNNEISRFVVKSREKNDFHKKKGETKRKTSSLFQMRVQIALQ